MSWQHQQHGESSYSSKHGMMQLGSSASFCRNELANGTTSCACYMHQQYCTNQDMQEHVLLAAMQLIISNSTWQAQAFDAAPMPALSQVLKLSREISASWDTSMKCQHSLYEEAYI